MDGDFALVSQSEGCPIEPQKLATPSLQTLCSTLEIRIDQNIPRMDKCSNPLQLLSSVDLRYCSFDLLQAVSSFLFIELSREL